MKKFIYPAVFKVCEDGGYFVNFPDLEHQGAYTQGETPEEAFKMAREVLEMVLDAAVEHGEELPEPSKPETIDIKQATDSDDDLGGFVSLVEGWVGLNKNDERIRAVRVNCTIPAWMKKEAEEEGLNLSRVLQQAIKEQLHIDAVEDNNTEDERNDWILQKLKTFTGMVAEMDDFLSRKRIKSEDVR